MSLQPDFPASLIQWIVLRTDSSRLNQPGSALTAAALYFLRTVGILKVREDKDVLYKLFCNVCNSIAEMLAVQCLIFIPLVCTRFECRSIAANPAGSEMR